jgi:peroxiredoxin
MNMAVGVGDRLPEVTLPGLDGPMVALGALRGKRRLLFFWGSW